MSNVELSQSKPLKTFLAPSTPSSPRIFKKNNPISIYFSTLILVVFQFIFTTLNNKQLKEIFKHANGRCHFCGDKISYSKYGKMCESGAWTLDHIIQKAKGGSNSNDNYLPACSLCNRFRWHRSGKDIRQLMYLGLIAKDEINKKTKIGLTLQRLKKVRDKINARRRRVL